MRVCTVFLTGTFLFAQLSLWAQPDRTGISEINIPIRVALKPLYDWVERSVDTVFTSEAYPTGWVQKGCDIRYRYKFWRSPLRLKATGQTLDLSFTGNYQMEGATRVCLNGVVISPWTPPCGCGFSEGARKVEVRFNNSLSVQPNYKLQLKIQPQRPVASDPCKVCLWEQDITDDVMNGLFEELVLAKQTMEKQYGLIDLKPYLTKSWSAMNQPVSMGAYGWMMLRPFGFRVNRIFASGDSLDISLGLRARPIIINTPPQASVSPFPPNWDNPGKGDDFSIRLGIDLRYDSLSGILNRTVLPLTIQRKKGLFRKKIRIDSLAVSGEKDQRIACQLFISGKYAGKLALSGKPHWDTINRTMRLTAIEYDLKTKNRILGSAADLFERPIQKMLEEKIQFNLAGLMEERRKWIEARMQSADLGPIKCSGNLNRIDLIGWDTGKEKLSIQIGLQGRMQCRADLSRFSL